MTMGKGLQIVGAGLLMALLASAHGASIPGNAVRWCTTSDAEQAKCKAFKAAIEDQRGATVALQCVQRPTGGSCYWELSQGSLDVTSLAFRRSYFAGKAYGLIPIVGEMYANDSNSGPFFYKALAIIRRNNTKINSLEDLRGAKSCFTVVYRNAGWAIPISLLVEKGLLTGDDCLDNVENAANFFSQGCAGNSQRPTYNYLGKDLSNMCSLCAGNATTRCTENDPYVGYVGAFKCLQDGRGDIAFTKNGIPEEATAAESQEGRRLEDFVLLCPDGSRKEIKEYDQCNWGSVTPRGVMVSPHLNAGIRKNFKKFLLDANGKVGNFQFFESASYGGKNLLFNDNAKALYDPKTEDYREFTGPSYVRTMENQTIQCDASVPSTLRWCVVTQPEIAKCHQMAVAFEFWFVKPRVQCVVADSLKGCMAKIRDRSADLVTLDGGEIYTGGKEFNLMPIMYEDYGKNDSKYWAVAVVKKSDPTIKFTNLKGKKSCHTGVGRTAGWDVPIATLIKSGQITVDDKCEVVDAVAKFFSKSCAPGALDSVFHPKSKPQDSANLCEDYGKNDSKYWAVAVVKKSDPTIKFTNLKGKKSCHTGVGRTAGWDVPIATLIKSGQITVDDKCEVVDAVAKFFSKSCAPGALDSVFHPKSKPQDSANLCELCTGQGKDHCARNTNEPNFGYTGAFRCLVESGGDVAFVNHLTVLENTDGKNQEPWAKDLKSNDFELACQDGSRKPVDKYEECNMAKVSAHSVVTSSSKTEKEVNAFIHALEKGQETYGGDDNIDFRMFYSETGSKDILFRDATKRLVRINPQQRNYRVYLGEFLNTAEFLDNGCNQSNE